MLRKRPEAKGYQITPTLGSSCSLLLPYTTMQLGGDNVPFRVHSQHALHVEQLVLD